jgi:hypothetical protein
LVKRGGEYIDYVAIHMGMGARRQDTVLRELSYEKEPERAWQELLEFSNIVENRVSQLEDAIAGAGSRAAIAITEHIWGTESEARKPNSHEWLWRRITRLRHFRGVSRSALRK